MCEIGGLLASRETALGFNCNTRWKASIIWQRSGETSKNLDSQLSEAADAGSVGEKI